MCPALFVIVLELPYNFFQIRKIFEKLLTAPHNSVTIMLQNITNVTKEVLL